MAYNGYNRMTRPDCAVICNFIYIQIFTHKLYLNYLIRPIFGRTNTSGGIE